jgi:5-formyltetrahydrofolate cyclo-ligase
MDKAFFRKKYKAKREELTATEIDARSLAISNHSLELPIWDGIYYHIFLSMSEKKEVDTEFLLHILQGRDKSIVVSKTNFSANELEHFLLQENTSIVVSNYGIPEPMDGIEVTVEKLDVVFIPLLAFDIHGNRIGYGKGYYDRFLSRCPSKTIFVGLSLFEAEDLIPSTQDDVKLHFCITPTKTIRF